MHSSDLIHMQDYHALFLIICMLASNGYIMYLTETPPIHELVQYAWSSYDIITDEGISWEKIEGVKLIMVDETASVGMYIHIP